MDAGKHRSSFCTKQLCFRPASAILTALPRSSLHLLCWLSRVLGVQLLNRSKETQRKTNTESWKWKHINTYIRFSEDLFKKRYGKVLQKYLYSTRWNKYSLVLFNVQWNITFFPNKSKNQNKKRGDKGLALLTWAHYSILIKLRTYTGLCNGDLNFVTCYGFAKRVMSVK